ncbi:hypothetical protein GGR54DRAFT_327985 [Hypoxylon sp. NC1633]|nr:hypothetical protein GGR54DRAFT_327985 [Hypoxylon sp. NC1633]
MPALRSAEADADADAHIDADAHYATGSDAKRRKTRKGTHSCWACKRRKEKCIFGSSTSSSTSSVKGAICLGCQRRGTRCVSQEFPDDISAPPDGARQMGDRMVRLEAMVEKLIGRLGHDDAHGSWSASSPDGGARQDYGIPTPASIESESTRLLPAHKPQDARRLTEVQVPRADTPRASRRDQSTAPSDTHLSVSSPHRRFFGEDVSAALGRYSSVAGLMYKILPSPEDSDIICRASYRSYYMFDEILTVPYKTVDQGGPRSPESIIVRPRPNTHPVLIARYMLQLAHILQQFPPNVRDELRGLSVPPQELLKELADIAISSVSTQDRILGSIEGVECVMLEGMYYANEGSLRLSWAACRRAMHLAQLMGFHLPGSRLRYQMLDPNTKSDPRYMWYRIVHFDRYLCLMLGLPQGSNDRSMTTDAMFANDTPLGRLERMHCVLSARILERNESNSRSQDFALTQELDGELQRAARSLPSRWWLTPNLVNTTAKDDQGLFWDVKRLITQMSHYNILNQLHLPYMLRSSNDHNHEYSKIACVNASREILSRFVVLRNFNRIAINCRTSDFLALMAAMTLILAHLDSHRRSSQAGNLLAHQYLSDRAMMEQVQETMEDVSLSNADVFSVECADLLRRLLGIEAEAADGDMARVGVVSVETEGTGDAQHMENEENDGVVRVTVPYFGTIKIAREGISREMLKSPVHPPDAHNTQIQVPSSEGYAALTNPQRAFEEAPVHPSQSINTGRPNTATAIGGDGSEELPTPTQASQNGLLPGRHPTVNNTGFVPLEPHTQAGLFDPLLQGLTADVDDWTFQGVDMAFFDNLMGGPGDDGYIDADGMAWQNDRV